MISRGETIPGVPRPPRRARKSPVDAARRLRRQPTSAEAALWDRLRQRQLAGLKFRRQHTIRQTVVDFYCAEVKLVIEVDGPVHGAQRAQNADRQAALETLGLRVFRVTNEDVLQHLDDVIARLHALIE